MSKLKGKIAVVTGASKGIGAGIAARLAEEGAAVVVNYASDRSGADRIVSDIKTKGGRAVAVQGDVAKAGDVKRLFEETQKAFGAPDILVNNAGVFKFTSLDDVAADEFHRQFDINVLGTLLATQEAARRFGDKGGSVINVSSVVSQSAPAGAAIYAATKGAVDTLTGVLAKELGPRNIRVNAVAPGLTETEGTHTAGFANGDFADHAKAQTPLGRIGQPDDIAKVAVFLASDDSAWLTGERIVAAGGYR
ncbi:MAG TPA: glucose 1-dehydrogenase [Rhizomicrobium sp.]|jgi:3-oxoacyl-[acyl-carrier protein] reductase|nr:glucose 1-dehydrogenase [Rhizomicrobium sp.]